MNKNSDWKQKLDELKDYISSNKEIYIDMREISIPEHLRPKFYELFDDIRDTFVDNLFSSMPMDFKTFAAAIFSPKKK